MIFDPYFFKMRFSYKLLHAVDLFPSYHQFVALKVNGKSQGLYLLVERPQDSIVRTKKEVMDVYRRRNPEDGHQVFETKYQEAPAKLKIGTSIDYKLLFKPCMERS